MLRLIICIGPVNRGSYMSTHVLLKLLNELGKIDKMRGLPSFVNSILIQKHKC